MLMYFLRGSLPWQGMKGNTKKAKYDNILEKKISTSTAVLCKGFPAEFRSYFDHVKSLRFDDRPDYDYLKRMFRELFFRKGYMYDQIMDWDIVMENGGNVPNRRVVGAGAGADTAAAVGVVDEGCPPAQAESKKLLGRGNNASGDVQVKEITNQVRTGMRLDNAAFNNRAADILKQTDGLATEGQITAFTSTAEAGIAVAGTNLRVHPRSNTAHAAVKDAQNTKRIKESDNNIFDMSKR